MRMNLQVYTIRCDFGSTPTLSSSRRRTVGANCASLAE
jgi:hypothetical protein